MKTPTKDLIPESNAGVREAIEQCFAEDILEQSTRLKVFPDEGESPASWKLRVRKAAVLSLLPASIDVVGKAREEEREACAKVAEEYYPRAYYSGSLRVKAGNQIAKAIRARTALASLTGEGDRG